MERDGPNCYLKFDKVRSVRVPKYVSGSIPSACISGPGEPNDIADDTCSYPDVEFMGGDLYSTYVKNLEGCRDLCAAESGCQLFTFYPEVSKLLMSWSISVLKHFFYPRKSTKIKIFSYTS